MLLLEQLEVYKLANEIGEYVWYIVNRWNYFPKITIGRQFTTAADSISLNLSEGYGRFHYKENKNFCFYSRGSAYETKNCTVKANSRNLITEDEYNLLIQKIEIYIKKLNGYIKSIGISSNE